MNAIFTMKDPNVKNEDLYFEDVTSIETVEDTNGNQFARIKTTKYVSFIEISLSQYDMKITNEMNDKDIDPDYFESNNMYGIFEKIGNLLNNSKKNGTTDMWYDGERILSPNKGDINWLMTFFEELIDETGVEFVVITGYYDPKMDQRNAEVDSYTGMYYLEIE